ncbi:hypothetical protein GLOIN_2v1639346 [Rhizophagus irregularis DAOM 181602=DAOM 197198]|uniref:Uncharacterized protein n=1 Tax=Rhizophagus irregularis (strain DAOM 181602 / DAOM 197198 / MUCL 43194) TaxID=747089 RepID=A0A2P4PS88_RHIID|nr:hypothetical protein GLOIN_2v1639346 [Rhizophagus irregularis DAOM 181602=DAOM 197198]POG68242.1 hypothetical protein GLOIN_2v1639346 [Rhizophagus irregularis DAOM 181602=DAOM 197198]|eukprot:XP_025175108.1 hypothetical protein GLOIN_2v1639346 [Rhizophagus irregularis DAOM 181602=DAOM 197198]
MKYLFWFIVLVCIATSLTVHASPLDPLVKRCSAPCSSDEDCGDVNFQCEDGCCKFLIPCC